MYVCMYVYIYYSAKGRENPSFEHCSKEVVNGLVMLWVSAAVNS